VLTFDTSLLTALGHPCIGAFIGYLTNKIAIRMLFRPLQPWYLFGVQVPMTPGVIPAKRHALAENIGEMVGRHLLTSKDIGGAISEEPFQEHMATVVDRRVQEILRRDLGSLPEIVPRRFKAYFKVGIKTLKYQLSEGVNRYLASDAFAEQLTAAIGNRLETLADRELNEVLDQQSRRSVYLFVDEVIRDLLQSKRIELWLGEYLAASLQRSAAQGRTIGDLVPAQLVVLLKGLVHDHCATLLQGMGAQLADPVLRAQMVKGILGGVDHFLDSLGPVGAMARGFLERETMDQKVHEYLIEKEEDLVAWLRNPEVQARMTTVLEESVDALLRKPVADLLASVEGEQLDHVCQECATQVLAIFRSEGTMTGLSALLHFSLEDLLDGGRRSLGDLGEHFFPDAGGAGIRDTLIRECIALFRSGKGERLVSAMLSSMVDTLLDRPIGLLYNMVPHGIRRGINDYILLTANRMLLQEVPGVVESLNIKRMVTEKVDGLDLVQLERLLLSIMEEQFKYINLFGALLGFFLGLINLVLIEFF
jgi:uncharacterized membrane protein YheB (UPF0754 family)